MAAFDIAIITVTYNRLDDACLASVRAIIDASPLRIAFSVVDNGSTELDVHKKVREHVPEAEIILRAKNHGMGRSCNVAARDIDAKYYFFLNPDTDIPDVALVQHLYDFLETTPKAGIVAPKITYGSGELQPTCRRFPRWYSPIAARTELLSEARRTKHHERFHMLDYDHSKRRMVDWAQGSALMMSSALFHEIGGFDERYKMYYEDVDLCRESWARHRPVYYLPERSMVHAYGKASDATKGVVHGVIANRATRWHIASWLRYQWKWFWR